MLKAYEGKEPYIFVSYAHKDSKTVIPIIELLAENGFRIWYDAGIEAGTEWPEYIAEHLNNSGCVVAFISNAAAASQNCRREINFAIDKKKEMLVIYTEEVSLSQGMQMQLGTLQALFFYRHPSLESFMETLIESRVISACKQQEEPILPEKPTEKPSNSGDISDKPSTSASLLHFKMLAEQGDLTAQKEYGDCFFYGKGTDINYETAAIWYRQAAQKNLPSAQFALGECYFHGHGVPMNYGEALKWYEKSAKKGDLMAQARLGKCYLDGKGVEKNIDKGIRWLTRSAKKGCDTAMAWLGDFYIQEARQGHYFKTARPFYYTSDPDYQRSYKRYQKQVNQAKTEAYYWLSKSVEYNNAEGQRNLARCYWYGIGVPKNRDEEIKWYFKAAEQGDVESQKVLKSYLGNYAFTADQIAKIQKYQVE